MAVRLALILTLIATSQQAWAEIIALPAEAPATRPATRPTAAERRAARLAELREQRNAVDVDVIRDEEGRPIVQVEQPQRPNAPAGAGPALPAIADANLRRQVEAQRKSIEALPAGPKVAILDLLRISIEQNSLAVELKNIPQSQTQTRLQATDLEGEWVSTNRLVGNNRYVSLTRYLWDEAAGTGLWQVTLNLNPSGLTISGRGGEKSGFSNVSFYQQRNQPVRLMQNAAAGGARMQNVQASDLLALLAQEPEMARKCLRPMFIALGNGSLLRPGATEVYRVFDHIPADAEVLNRLQTKLLPQLDAALFTEREAAHDALARLGRAGVLAVLRTPKEHLSEEQVNRLGRFLADHVKLQVEDAAAARRDVDFLLDCLSDEDRRVREAALEALNELADKPLKFELDAPQSVAAAAAERLRPLLPKPKSK